MSILVIDDDQDHLTMMEMTLTGEGYTVTCVSSGDAAFRELQRRQFSLVLLDLDLGEESGIDILRRIRAEVSERLPVVMLSGRHEDPTVVEALEVGADDYIHKLTKPAVLLARIKRRLRASEGTAADDGQIGPYKLLEILGEGTSAVVYRAFDHRLHRDVAVKVLKAGTSLGFKTAERFRREAQLLASFRHPKVVEIFDFGDVPWPYIVLEYVEGVDIDVLLKEGTPSVRKAAEIVFSLLETLQCIHDLGLVHRDLKPSNIRLGTDGFPHLLDFGLCKLLTRDDSLTPEGAIVGTLQYASPEQLNNSPVTRLTDIHGVGTVLYALLTGCAPFQGDLTGLITQVLSTLPEPPSQRRSDGDTTLDTFVLKMMAKDPAARPQSCQQAAAELLKLAGL